MKRRLWMRILLAVMALVLLCGMMGAAQAAKDDGPAEPETWLVTGASWKNCEARNIQETDALIHGELTVTMEPLGWGGELTIDNIEGLPQSCTLYVTRDYSIMQDASVFADAVWHGNISLYLKKYSGSVLSDYTKPKLVDGKVSVTYYLNIGTVKDLNNSQGTKLSPSPNTTYYFRWIANFPNGSTTTSSMSVFTTKKSSAPTPTPAASWGTPAHNSSNQFYDWVYYDKNKVSLFEVGIFISSSKAKVEAAKYKNFDSSCVWTKTDTGGVGAGYNNNKKGLYVYYKEGYFPGLQPGVKYYYKFYSVATNANGPVVYSTISSYTMPGTPTTYALTVKAGTGGTVNSVSGKYAKGTLIDLKATPSTGYSFSKWTVTAGSVANSASAVTTFTMPGSAATVTANFTQNKYKLALISLEGGTITGTAGDYVYGAKIALKAVPKTGYRFVGWQSDKGGSFANGTAAETTFTMPANPVNVYAVFEAVDYTITAQVSGSGSVNCSKTKAKYGESVTLTAVPAAGHVFKGWVSGDVTIADPAAKSITIKMPAKNITVTAKFEKESTKGTLADVTLTKTSYTYTGSAIKPGMTVTAVVNGSTVTLTSAQYKVTYSNNIKVGTATVTVTGVDNITGSISKTFKITKVKLYSAKVINASLPYNGKEHKPILTVKAKVNGVLKTLTKTTDYTATYSNNVEPGTATVTVKGKGNYTGTIKTTFKINKLKMSAAVVTLSKTTMTYTGKALKPKVTVKYKIGSKMVTLTKGIDYTVTYKDNIEAGTATVIIKGKGHFTGTQKVTFTIRRR